jgi:putative flippase GtrA
MNAPTPISIVPIANNDPLRTLGLELVGYALASGAALAVDMAILASLVKLAHWPYLLAASLSFFSGATVAYLLSVKFVFRHRQVGKRPLEFSYFVGLGLLGLAVNAATLFVAVSGAGLDLMLAKLLAAAATFLTNFTVRRQMLFAPARMRS